MPRLPNRFDPHRAKSSRHSGQTAMSAWIAPFGSGEEMAVSAVKPQGLEFVSHPVREVSVRRSVRHAGRSTRF
jgi:hemolysin-activating ACP:hemolysin acyltransferase